MMDFHPEVKCEVDGLTSRELTDPEKLRHARAGLLRFTGGDGVSYSLIFEPDPTRGVSLHLHVYCRTDFSKNCGWCSVGEDREAVDADWVLLDNGATVPSGSFVGWEAAAKTAAEFLTAPSDLPTAVGWVDTDTLAWPESDY